VTGRQNTALPHQLKGGWDRSGLFGGELGLFGEGHRRFQGSRPHNPGWKPWYRLQSVSREKAFRAIAGSTTALLLVVSLAVPRSGSAYRFAFLFLTPLLSGV